MKILNKPHALRLVSLLILTILTVSFFGCNDDATATPDESTAPTIMYEIAVIKSDITGNAKNILKGYEDLLEASGYFDGENIKISYYESEEKKPDYNALAKQAVEDNPDLIFTVGTSAAKAAKKATTKIPVIFAGVSDPIGAGLLKSTEKPDGNITGVSSFTPVYQQLQFAKFLVPKSEKISVLYMETEENSILISSLIKEECAEFGLEYSAFTANDEEELLDELSNALEECQMLYLPEDELTKASISEIIKTAKEKKIPVFASDTKLVNSGALATSVHDYKDIGSRAANMSLLILTDAKSINEMPVVYPDDCINVVNTQSLEFFDIKIPSEEDDIIYV